MPNEFQVATWEKCLRRLDGIQKNYSDDVKGVWFRGHANADWPLTTTLERRLNPDQAFSFDRYYSLVRRIRPAIETYTDAIWNMTDPEDVSKWAADYDGHFREPLKCYEYLAHLRHNGFPSPLLDSTRSPYVAAYFAFSKPQGENVAIFAFSEMPRKFKSGSFADPELRALGPYVRTHKRHFRQQSRYTICAQFVQQDGWYFGRHQAVFDRNEPEQDMLWKIVIPASERIKVLTALSSANVNAFSLFESEESLMEMLAIENIDLWRRN